MLHNDCRSVHIDYKGRVRELILLKKMGVFLGTIVFLTACSEASDDTSVISPKELNESEKRYLDIGTEYAYVYETSDFPDDLSTVQ